MENEAMATLDRNIDMIRDGAGPPLVLLHCLGVDHHFWDFAKPLASIYTLYRYDLPGHGTSPVPRSSYGIADLSDQLFALMRQSDLEKAHIGGISLGGLVAQHFAANHPKMVDKLVLVDTTPRYTEEMRIMWAERAATARGQGVTALVEGLLKIWFSPGAIARGEAGVRYVRETLERCDGEGYALACEALASADLRDEAARIKAQTLVICGDEDIPSFIDAAHWLAKQIKGAELEWISGTRHASILERPREALIVIKKFLDHEEDVAVRS